MYQAFSAAFSRLSITITMIKSVKSVKCNVDMAAVQEQADMAGLADLCVLNGVCRARGYHSKIS